MARIKYHSSMFSGLDSNPEDMGIDLPATIGWIMPPMSTHKIYTGITMEFPVFSRFRRFIFRVLTGLDITGVGGIIKPRGRTPLLVGSGVVDPGYRGELIIKVFNPTDDEIIIGDGDAVAQLVPTLCIHYTPIRVGIDKLNYNTRRKSSGGIHA